MYITLKIQDVVCWRGSEQNNDAEISILGFDDEPIGQFVVGRGLPRADATTRSETITKELAQATEAFVRSWIKQRGYPRAKE